MGGVAAVMLPHRLSIRLRGMLLLDCAGGKRRLIRMDRVFHCSRLAGGRMRRGRTGRGGMRCRGVFCGSDGLDGVVCGLSHRNARKTALQEPERRSIRAFGAGSARGAGRFPPANEMARTGCDGGYRLGGNHNLGKQRTSGMADVDAQGAHETVNLLANFQEGDGAQEPDQEIACYGLFPDFCDFLFHLCFCDCTRGERKKTCQNEDYGQKFDDFVVFLRNNTSDQTERGFAIKEPTMDMKRRRHHAFIISKKT